MERLTGNLVSLTSVTQSSNPAKDERKNFVVLELINRTKDYDAYTILHYTGSPGVVLK